MVIEENWAVPLDRIEGFFAQNPQARREGDGFSLEGCHISLRALPPGRVGAFPVPRTQVRFVGEEARVRALHHGFFLEFLSAGG